MITRVKKSRKEYRCSKCGEIIPVGSAYIRGDLNFSKPIIRCTKCGLKGYEVTTSEYVRSVGPIVEDWRDSYLPNEEGRDSIVDELGNIRDELQDHFDNMPEGLQYGDTGQLLEERISYLDDAISELENIDFEDFDDNEDIDFEELIDNALSVIEY